MLYIARENIKRGLSLDDRTYPEFYVYIKEVIA